MGNTFTNVYAKSNYDWLCIDKALGFRKSDNDNSNKSKYNVCSELGPFLSPKTIEAGRLAEE